MSVCESYKFEAIMEGHRCKKKTQPLTAPWRALYVSGSRCRVPSSYVRRLYCAGKRQGFSAETKLFAAGKPVVSVQNARRRSWRSALRLQKEAARCIQRCWRHHSFHLRYINRAAFRIQEAWRNRCRHKLYLFYRDLIRFRCVTFGVTKLRLLVGIMLVSQRSV